MRAALGKHFSFPVLLSVFLGGLFTATLTYITIKESLENRKEDFEIVTASYTDQRISEIKAIETELLGIRTLFNTALSVDRDQFHLFNNDIMGRHTSIKEVYFSPVVRDSNQTNFVKYMKKNGFPTYRIYNIKNEEVNPEVRNDYSLPVKFLEPLKPMTARFLGLDFMSSKHLKRAIDRSIETSEPVSLIGEDVFEGDVALVVATYAGKQKIPQSLEERIKAMNGVITVRINFEELNNPKANTFDAAYPVRLTFYEGGQETLLYETGSLSFGDSKGKPLYDYNFTKKFSFGNNTLYFKSYLPLSIDDIISNAVYITVAGGLIFTLLLSYFVYRETNRHEQVRQLVRQRTNELDERNTELRTVVGKLESSNEELERFAYVASHDLQEPLRMVIGFTSLLKQDYADDLDDNAQLYIKTAADGAKRMQDLILDLLDYSRVSREKQKLEKVDFELVIKAAIENLSESIREMDAKVTYADMPTVMANSVRMIRLVQNLISNGIKYQKKGNRPVVDVLSEEKDLFWQFSVKDNGIGMKQEYLDRIFQPFKRLHNYTEYSGTGIGLAVCKKIVESQGGNLWVESVEGKGSTFYFTIPKNELIEKGVEKDERK